MRAEAIEQKITDPAAGLLASLAVHERNAIHRASQVQLCAAGDVLLRANSRSRFAFFPINAVVAVRRTLRDDRSIAVGLFGNDGMAGIDIVVDAPSQHDDIVVQTAGSLYCTPAEDLRHMFEGTGRLQRAILRFAYTLLSQVAQHGVCVRYHDVEQRLAKWLLMIDDRRGSIEVERSTALLAEALGAETRAVDGVLTALRSAGAIQARRGALEIRREELEARACECYEQVQLGGTRAVER